jgi:nucleoside-diphosphate-sugar epimerase
MRQPVAGTQVLVTGSGGFIGMVVAAHLRLRGYQVVPYDAQDGDDVRDLPALRRAMRGCEAVVHMAALADDDAGPPEDIMAVNVLGTWHVLQAARELDVKRVVSFSSMQVMGTANGYRRPDYLPVDDDHPLRPSHPYGISKQLGEEMCEDFTSASGIPTVCLRPVMVCDERIYAAVASARARDASAEWEPFWEFGAYVDVRDVAAAVELALGRPLSGHSRLLLSAADAWTSAPSRDMARRIMPDVPWRGGPEYEADPYRALVDASRASQLLGWKPRYRWKDARASTGRSDGDRVEPPELGGIDGRPR